MTEIPSAPDRTCDATDYGAIRECGGPPDFDVVYTTGYREDRKEDKHPACMRHALAEMDAHLAAQGIADVDIRQVVGMWRIT